MAFRIAVSGLQAASTDLDVTGNNIANSQTAGFKQSRAEFADVYAVSSLGNSVDQIGQGVQVSGVSQLFAQGNVTFTENSLDLAINGDGFFVLEDQGARAYSRAGQFGVDKDGFVVNSLSQNLIGYRASNGAVTGAIGPMQLTKTNLAPQASTAIDVHVNLDAGETVPVPAFDPTDTDSYNSSTSLSVFDSLGSEHLATMYFRKNGTNSWETHLRIDNDNTQTTTIQPMTFDSNGTMVSPIGGVGYGT